METKQTDTAFLADAFPCNPLPFLNRMKEIVRDNGTDATKTPQFQANLLVVMQQTFGQLATIDLFELYGKIKAELQKHDKQQVTTNENLKEYWKKNW